MLDALRFRIESNDCAICVIGLGYVGLPLAHGFCDVGFRVTGIDSDVSRVKQLASTEGSVDGIPCAEIRAHTNAGRFVATENYEALATANAIIICVPTPLGENNEPDLSYVERAGEEIAARLRRGQLIVLESTTYPGTTEEVLRPILESGGLRAGMDFLLAYAPEREDPGNTRHTKIPRVVGGVDAASRAAACLLYEKTGVATVSVSSLGTAEAVKLTENVFRAVNIALVNELKVIYDAMGVDIWEVVDAASTKPFGYMPFYPGPGMGGHCIPIDPFYLAWKARQHGESARFVELAGEINTAMPGYIVERIEAALAESDTTLSNAKIHVLGVAYKENISDVRESPGLAIIDILLRRGAKVSYTDPHVSRIREDSADGTALESIELEALVLSESEAVLIATAHDAIDYTLLTRHAKRVFDTRNAMDGIDDPRGVVVKV